MTTLIEILKNHNATISNGVITITARDMDEVANDIGREAIAVELQDILDRNSTQAYYPAIIKCRINSYKSLECTKK